MSLSTVLLRSVKLFVARLLDYVVPVKRNRLCFVTRANVPLSGNLRIMLDTMATQPGLEIGFFKEGSTPPETAQLLQSQGVKIMSRYNIQALLYLLSSQVIVLSHSARDAFITRRKRGRRVINLWHGVALKRIETLMRPQGSRFQFNRRQALIRRNAGIYDAMIASNPVDRLVNALAFGLAHHKVHPIGLPRFDYLQPDFPWPADLASQRHQLSHILRGRPLVLYAPTFRDSGTTLADLLTPSSREAIQAFCRQTGTVFGIRPHPYRTHELTGICDGEHIIDLSTQRYPEAAILLAATQALVVDYSSIWVDYLILQRPICAFVPDLENYTQQDRGFIYDQAAVFPGPFFRTWTDILSHISHNLEHPLADSQQQKHRLARALLLPAASAGSNVRTACAALICGQDVAERTTPFTFSTPTASQPLRTP